jgi:hypothetical protein
VAFRSLTAPPDNGTVSDSFEFERELLIAHRESFDNRQRLLVYGGPCGCFHCLRRFEASDVRMWVGRGEATALDASARLPTRDGYFGGRGRLPHHGHSADRGSVRKQKAWISPCRSRAPGSPTTSGWAML